MQEISFVFFGELNFREFIESIQFAKMGVVSE